jgi:prepilin-type N-terminal cleavage/methylation domain-containing protein
MPDTGMKPRGVEGTQARDPVHRAFTLIELLVVVAIIAVLISILLPAMAEARAQGRKTVCMANMHQIGVGIYNYWTAENGHVPYIISPMVNNAFGAYLNGASMPDAQVDPFDRERWPLSLPNVLMPVHMGESRSVFRCPSAVNGWPKAGAFRYTYREAAINAPNGAISPPNSYFREHFGFLDGRELRKLRIELTGDPIIDSARLVTLRGTYIRDLVKHRFDGEPVIGPHKGGILLLNRDLQVEFRSQRVAEEDLSPNGAGSQF